MSIILGEQRDERGSRPQQSPWYSVPWRTIIGSVLVIASFIGLVLAVVAVWRIILWVFVAGFFAVVLAPAVRRTQALVGGHRALATAIVMFSSALAFLGLAAVFVMPIRNQVVQIVSDFPGTIDAAASGRGPIGQLVTRLNLDSLVRDNRDDLTAWADNISSSSVSIARTVVAGLLAFVTMFVTAFLLLTQSSAIGGALLRLIPQRRQAAAKRVAVDAAGAVSGYMIGNLLISLVAGVSAFLCLLLLHVPNPAVLALWVAFADLIPLIGATLGASAAVLAAFFESNSAGIIALVFFVLYQQFENSVLQNTVMARTVRVNPLVVLLSVLVGVELLGVAGALLAIPLAGSLQVLAKEIMGELRRDHLILPDTPEADQTA